MPISQMTPYNTIKIGTLELSMPFIQAALAGYTDYPMRHLARRFGCPLTFTGVMLDRIALHPKAMRQLKFLPHDGEHPVVAQILGDDPAIIAQAAAVFEQVGYAAVDLNFACPVPKVLRRLRGGFLMQKPDIIRQAVRLTRQAVACPISMKIRIGFDHSARVGRGFPVDLPDRRRRGRRYARHPRPHRQPKISRQGRLVAHRRRQAAIPPPDGLRQRRHLLRRHRD